MVKKIIRQLHLYLGLVSGIVVFILGITGCLYAFIEEVSAPLYADRREIQAPGSANMLPISTLKKLAVEAVPETIPCTRAFLFPGHNKTVAFVFQKINPDAVFYNSYMEFYQTVFVNPYTGRVQYIENTKWEFFNVVLWLHMTLLFSYEIGNALVLWTCIIFLILLVTGLILWWPRSSKTARQKAFWYKWKAETSLKRKNYDLHNVSGFYMLLPAVLLTITGMLWASENVHDAVHWIANKGVATKEQMPLLSDTTQKNISTGADTALAYTLQHAPKAAYIMLGFARKPSAPLSVRVNETDRNFRRVELYFDQYTGKLLQKVQFADKNTGDQVQALNYDLHVGSILGLPGKILAFLASLICASLPVTGFFIWWGRKKKNQRKLSASR